MILGFKPQFEKPIQKKTKRHTIRAPRKGKRQIKVGDRLDLYVDARKKSMRSIGRFPCVRIQTITITVMATNWVDVLIDDTALDRVEKHRLARADGFKSFAQMMKFWDGRLPFKGFIIHWNPDDPQTKPNRAPRSARRRKGKGGPKTK